MGVGTRQAAAATNSSHAVLSTPATIVMVMGMRLWQVMTLTLTLPLTLNLSLMRVMTVR